MLLTVPLGVYPYTKQDVIHVVYNLRVIMRNLLLASRKGESEHRQEQTQENPATRG